jgi:hypothetical protein
MFSEGQRNRIFGEDYHLVRIEICVIALNISSISVYLLQQQENLHFVHRIYLSVSADSHHKQSPFFLTTDRLGFLRYLGMCSYGMLVIS